MKGPIKEFIQRKWHCQWNSPQLMTNLKYRNIRNSTATWPSSFQSNQRYEKILTRLRIGHTHLTHQYILKGDSPPVCDHCLELLTVKHLLADCQIIEERGVHLA